MDTTLKSTKYKYNYLMQVPWSLMQYRRQTYKGVLPLPEI